MKDISTFLEFAESLKLVRKSKIEDLSNDKRIDDIYTDLLPNNGVINKLNLPRTTILVGRKGTGKSTIFQKSQKDLITNKRCISIYIDVKSLYENSTPIIPEEVKAFGEEFTKYLIYSNLVKEIILDTKKKLDEFVQNSIFQKIIGYDYIQINTINEQLQSIEDSINDVIKTVESSLIRNYKCVKEDKASEENSFGITMAADPKLNLGLNDKTEHATRTEFDKTLVSYLDLKSSLISKLTRIKEILEIDHLYIFLDDFSEIDYNAQEIFMDWFIAPLNNLSDDFVKFKIAVYPHRFYYGRLDNSKIDEISLEFFDAFYTYEKEADISKMEGLALDYTKRLLKRRLEVYFPDNHWDRFFDLPEDQLFNLLFSVSFNNPRKIGYILSFCYESCLIHDSRITKEAIENASKKYFTDITLKYFLANQFVTRPFNDKISNEHQYELLNKILERQKINSSSANRTSIKGKPANHFVVSKEMAYLMDNLELNGFITTYNNVQDNNDQLSTIYSLDYGLCRNYGINFQRASDDKLMKYYQQARFNMNILISDYFKKTQIIKCTNGHEFPYDNLDILKRYKMRCPDCMDNGVSSFCEITLSNLEIREKLLSQESKRNWKIVLIEFLILDYLNDYNKVVSISKIADSLDKSTETIQSNINKLLEKGLVNQDIEASKQLRKEVYMISSQGTQLVKAIIKLIKEQSDINQK